MSDMEEMFMELTHSPVLFLDERGDPLTFVIKPCLEKEALREMIEFGGGEIVSTPGDYGITLIPPEVVLIGNDEVFSTHYIKDCCTRNKLLNLGLYRLNTESKYPDSFDVMDVLLKYTSWSGALKGIPYERSFYIYLNSSPSNSSFDDDLDSYFKLAPGPVSSCAVQPRFQNSCTYSGMDNNKREKKSSEDNEASCSKWLQKSGMDNNGRRKHFHEEKTSSEPMCSKWLQKGKRKIVRRIESSDSEAQEEETESNERVENIPHKGHNSTFKVSKCNIEIEAEDTNFRSSKLGLNNHQSSKKTSPKASKYRSLQKEPSSSSELEIISDDELWNVPVLKSKKPSKLTRRDYVDKERRAIISFISKHRSHNYVKGREIWQKAEAARICPGRTWQSMKEHFIKKIIPNIKSYNLSEEEVRKFQKPFC